MGLEEDERVSDNATGELHPRLSPEELRWSLHSLVMAEWNPNRLAPTQLSLSTAAIDGTHQVTLRLWKLRDLTGSMYALIRALRSTLVSSDAAVCLDLHVIPGARAEMATIEPCIDELMHVCGRIRMIERVTADAGNTSLSMATKLHAAGISYFLGWTHARQLVRVRRVPAGEEPDETTTGDRYYVSSETAEQLGAKEAQEISRMHWPCENEGHWTSNKMFNEAAIRAPLSRHPVGPWWPR